MVQKGSSASVQKPQAAAGQALNYEAISQDPLKHVITFIEKKIRNLDKRKAKLDGYKKMVEDGKPLDPDQTAAASKYDEVIGSLEFAKDLIKNFESTTLEVLKQQRKATRRELMAREEADSNRVCFVVRATRIMELLHENELLKDDFLNGTNGACVVSKMELDQLVNFYELFIMKSYDSNANIVEDANSAGNHMFELAEGRMKDIVGTTYKELHAMIDRINDCKYFEDLREMDQSPELQTASDNPELVSVDSEYSAEDEESEKQEKEFDESNEDSPRDAIDDEPNAMSPNSSEPISSPSGFSSDAPLKTAEFLPSSNSVAYTAQNETDWQPKQQIQSKPEVDDYRPQNVDFQYDNTTTNSNQNLQQQQPSLYHTQRIQEVLAEVQGPCQFLQESIIDQAGASTMMSFTSMDVHQQTLPPHPMAPNSHVRTSALESVFQGKQNISPTDQSMLTPQRAVPGAQKDSSSHLPNAVTHTEQLQTTTIPSNDSVGQSSANTYISNMPSTNAEPNMDYAMNHNARKPADNLGLGQTTFGGQQPPADPRLSFNTTSGEQNSYETPDITSKVSYAAVPDSSVQSEIQGMMTPHTAPSLQSPDPSATHIPLPNEQQSGYRSYQTTDNQQNEAKNISMPDDVTNEQRTAGQDQNSSDINSKPAQDTAVATSGSGSPRSHQGKPSSNSPQGDQNSGYNSQNPGQQQVGPQSGRSGRGGNNYSGNSGYRSGPVNQGGNAGGGYHQQRGNNYRGGRYNGSYDSMGRPGNYSSGYQNNQSGGYGFRQDQYAYRRGTGGGMRGGRGHPGRGNPRGGGGGGNYNRSRTFRPQNSSEQTV